MAKINEVGTCKCCELKRSITVEVIGLCYRCLQQNWGVYTNWSMAYSVADIQPYIDRELLQDK